ncbi:MAG: M28 family peptidase [Candidatus Rokuibacteriota bacterium]
MSPLRPLPYHFVDDASTAAGPSRVSENARSAATGVDVATLEPDVRYLASAELQGRLRGTEGNARARAHIIASLKAAGLAPLFGDAFEQPTYPNGRDAGLYAINVGAIYRAPERDARWIVLVAHYDHRGVIGGKVQAGADDNASSVALLLALGHSLGRSRPQLRRHVVLLFPDAEEPPDVRTERMGSTWFWRHPPLPADRLDLALVFDLMGGRASPEVRTAGLADALFVLGAEADPSLIALVRDVAPAARVEPVRLSLPMIEVMPYRPGARFARSDYHGLREHGGRPFLFLTTGRTETYHSAADTPETVDYERLPELARWVTRLAVHAAEIETELGWHDRHADARGDARTLLRLYGAIDASRRIPWLLRRALAADRRRVERTLKSWNQGISPTPKSYRALQLASIRVQAALWHPSGWWFALW